MKTRIQAYLHYCIQEYTVHPCGKDHEHLIQIQAYLHESMSWIFSIEVFQTTYFMMRLQRLI